MEQWISQHRTFVVEAFCNNGDSAVTTQRLFRRHFNIPCHGRVPLRYTIKEWVQNFREKASALKCKPRGRIPTVRTPESVDKYGYREESKAFSEGAFPFHSSS